MANIKLLLVGGGGGGGTNATNWYGSGSGGGGAGGYQYDASFSISLTSFAVTVGSGGAINTNGSNSIFSTITALGGGTGGGQYLDGSNGGSGGGGGYGPYSGGSAGGIGSQGSNGCGGANNYYAGGGGGKGGAGGTYGVGGLGILNPITSLGYLCGGGGGGWQSGGNGGNGGGGDSARYPNVNATSGTINTGGGGGGSWFSYNSPNYYGGSSASGGSGLVQIAYKTDGSDGIGILSTGGTITTLGIYTIHTFTSSGTFNAVSPNVILTTQDVTDINIITATGNGTVTSDGGYTITERGICWNTSTLPTIANYKVIVAGTTGVYSGQLTSLSENTFYYVRTYATNAIGTSYGNEVTFTTLPLSSLDLIKDISGISGNTYAVSVNVGGTVGTITAKLGTTGYSQVINAGSGVTIFQGVYGGLSGLIFTQSPDFNGTIDDVMWVMILGDTTINWSLNTLTNLYLINSSVTFKRIEDKEVSLFNMYRYLDVLFKDLDGYVTMTLTEETNDKSQNRIKTFIVGNTTGSYSPFVKKRISMLSKNQAILISFSNAKLNETFTICQYSLTGFKESRKLYSPTKIISI